VHLAGSPTYSTPSPNALTAVTTVYLPNITRMLGGPDGWQTPFIVQNVGSVTTDLQMSFYAFADGRLVKTRTASALAPGTSVAHDPNSDTELPEGGQFSVVVTSSAAPIVVVVNEHRNVRDPARQEALSYSGVSSGSTVVSLPYVAKQAGGWLTTIVVQDLGPEVATVRAHFIALADGATTDLARTIAPGRAAFIDPSTEPSLAAGKEYSATLSADQQIAAVVNAHNDAPGVAHPMGHSYNGVPADNSTETFLPYVAKRALPSQRTTRLFVQNAGLKVATPAAFLRPLDAATGTRIDLAPLAPGAATVLDLGGARIPDGEYSVRLTGGQLAAVAASTTPTSAMGYASTAQPAQRLYLPNVTRTLGGPSGWTTPILLQATSPFRSDIALSWFRLSDGVLAYGQVVRDLENGSARRIDPRSIATLADDTQYAVMIDAPLGAAAVVTELSGGGGDGEMAYEGSAPPGPFATPLCTPASGAAGTPFTCRFAGLPPGSDVNVAISTDASSGMAQTVGTTAADGTFTWHATLQSVGTRTLTLTAGSARASVDVTVTAGAFDVRLTAARNGSLAVHTASRIECIPTVTLPDGAILSEATLIPRTTDDDGDASWPFTQIESPEGITTLEVACASGGAIQRDRRNLIIGAGRAGHLADVFGSALPDVTIRVWAGVHPEFARITTTDAFGNYALAGPVGETVQFAPPLSSRLATAQVRVLVTNADAVLVSGKLLQGTTTNRGAVAAGMNIFITVGASATTSDVTARQGGPGILLLTDADGSFSVRLASDTYTVASYPVGPCCFQAGDPLGWVVVDMSHDNRISIRPT
jgi:hypothetical protein